MCRACGFDTEAFKVAQKDNYWAMRREVGHYDEAAHHRWFIEATGHPDWPRKHLSLHEALWEADHIVEVVLGGGETGLDNYQTLCLGCHRRKTAGLAKARSTALKEFHQTQEGQSLVERRKTTLKQWNELHGSDDPQVRVKAQTDYLKACREHDRAAKEFSINRLTNKGVNNG